MGPQCIITFDDGYKSTYSIAFQYMQSKGIVGTVYINGDSIDNPGSLSLSNILEMNLAGWCIGSHTYGHVDLSKLTNQELYNELIANINFLNSIGIPNGAYHLAYPFGHYNPNVLDVMHELGIKTGRYTDPGFINNQYLNELNLYELPTYGLGPGLPVSMVESWINEAINTNSTIIITIHDIIDSNPTDEYLTSDFKLIIDYIASSGIRTITIDDFFEEVINAKANSPKPVTLYRNGSYVGSYNIIAEAVIASKSGDTITLDNGSTFYENNLIINKNLTFNVSDNGTATINGTTRAILNDDVKSIFGIYPGINVNLQNLIIENGSSAILNMGNLTINNCTFQNNNTIYGGGAIYNTGTLTAISCTFIGNAASYGGAVYNLGNTTLNICRIVGNIGTDIYNDGGSIYALYNWWGQNSGPRAEQIYGTSNYSPWIYMTFTSNPNIILTGNISQIIADFNNIYDGTTVTPFNPNLGHLSDGIPVTFTGDSLGTVNPQTMVTLNGKATTNFIAGPTGGVSHPTAAVDASTVTTDVTIIAPLMVISTDPANHANNVPLDKVIKVTFNKNIQSGANYSGIYLKNTVSGENIAITKYISGNTLTIQQVSNKINNTLYQVYIPAGAVKDAEGNSLAAEYTYTFTTIATDTTPPKVTSTNPANNATGAGISSPITITFNENITKGDNFQGIYIQKLSTGSKMTITSKVISGKTLTLYLKSIRSLNTTYLVYLPAGAVEDYAGNSLVNAYSFSFKTKSEVTPPKVTSTNPTNNAIGVSLNTTPIIITFSENIVAGNNYSGIYIKNLTTGNKVSIASKTISNNTLTIKETNNRLANCQYQVYIPAGAVKDSAGNNLAATYTFKYST
jgi:peptidoglycan/xylan/chitin deacetylase (PgdA/CDA1 family)/methionine-rich copper-binding protein CopC